MSVGVIFADSPDTGIPRDEAPRNTVGVLQVNDWPFELRIRLSKEAITPVADPGPTTREKNKSQRKNVGL